MLMIFDFELAKDEILDESVSMIAIHLCRHSVL